MVVGACVRLLKARDGEDDACFWERDNLAEVCFDPIP